MDPPDGVIDARQAHMVDDPAFLQGIDTILVGAPEGADPSCWTLSESDENTLRHPPYPPELDTNDIRGAESNGDGTYTIRLARPITPGEVTTITYTDNSGVASTGCFISHPANVDGINEGQSTIY